MAHVIVLGGGPAGLMAADVVSAAGVKVTLCERMPSVGRKLLMAGRGGLNLTHSEPLSGFLDRYGAARGWLRGPIGAFPPEALRAFVQTLGQETFVGSSGRIFPRAMKASPLLRAWLAKLARQGVELRVRHKLVGLGPGGQPLIAGPDGTPALISADATVLALGGASWPRLGSDGGWVAMLEKEGIRVSPLTPANATVEIAWSSHFRTRHAGAPLKRIAVTAGGVEVRGEAVITADGLEGGPLYRLNPLLRDELRREGRARLLVDLRPDLAVAALAERLERPRGKQSLSSWLRKSASLDAAAVGLLREALANVLPESPVALAAVIKALPLVATGLGGMERAISTAGGIALDEVGPDMMLKRLPGLFVAGEMLDWEAPTGGYLLQACISTGHAAGRGVLSFLAKQSSAVAEAAAESPNHIPS
jgi:uncharacterized flavoprotein (TIGR03862 family)